jgi:hypothetical protein
MAPKTNASRIDDLERRVAALEQQLKARGSKAGSAKQKSAELKWGKPGASVTRRQAFALGQASDLKPRSRS